MYLNSYKYLGQQEMLMGRHTDAAKLERENGKCLFDGTQRERVKVYIVEATSKDPNFLYSKMVWYLDPEDWQMRYSDRCGRDWLRLFRPFFFAESLLMHGGRVVRG